MLSAILNEKKLSVKVQTAATVGAVVSAVAIPQIFHLMGAMSGLGTSLGEIFLPMHLPIILVGLLAGPYAGAISGFLAPLLSFLLTQMPTAAMLPFMMTELCIYGLSAGILRKAKMPSIFKILVSQLSGRVIRALAILIGFYAFSSPIPIAAIWNSIGKGIIGLTLQWVLLPLIVYRIEGLSKNEL